jgi:hypothetical protein
MASVNVERSVVRDAATLCSSIIRTLSASRKNIRKIYGTIGPEWRDNKYQRLGEIVEECDVSINGIERELKACLVSIKKVEQSIAEYEGVNLTGSYFDKPIGGGEAHSRTIGQPFVSGAELIAQAAITNAENVKMLSNIIVKIINIATGSQIPPGETSNALAQIVQMTTDALPVAIEEFAAGWFRRYGSEIRLREGIDFYYDDDHQIHFFE